MEQSEQMMRSLMDRFPSIGDLRARARKRIPHVAWQYLETGTGLDTAGQRNREALDQILLTPRFIQGQLEVDLKTELLGRSYAAPFGIAPMGLCGLVWPDAERILARSAHKAQIPYALSTVATQTPATVGPEVGDMGWFQLYPPKDPEVRKSMLEKVAAAGFHTLIVTADVPAPGRREASRKAGLTIPPKIGLKMIWQGATHPVWSMQILKHGLPRLRFVETFSPEKDLKSAAKFARFGFRGDLNWDYIKAVRDLWPGTILLKGLLHPDDATTALAQGIDGLIVSNHGGRQFDGVPAAITALPPIVEAVQGKVPLIFDSGVRTGLDILRALHLGADFVLIGRPYLYGLAALGKRGPDHVNRIFREDLINNMKQYGVRSLAEIKSRTAFPGS